MWGVSDRQRPIFLFLSFFMILLCNDDGFNAEGLRILRKELLTLDDVMIVAPET